jgi:hypothetical protein
MANELDLAHLASDLYRDLELLRDTADSLEDYETRAQQLILDAITEASNYESD